jgi:peptide/nickel transport system substrate-binding protein
MGRFGTVARISPAGDEVVVTARTGGMPVALTLAAGRVWVGVDAGAAGHRGGTLRIAASRSLMSIDPAYVNFAEPAQFGGLAYNTLVTFDHTGGVDGLRMVPDLALTLATPTDDGRTYTFQLRRAIHYSNGQPLRASDLLHGFERLFTYDGSPPSPGAGYFTDIVGTSRCTVWPYRCDLSRGIVVDDRAGTITFHLTKPDPEFLDQLTEDDFAAPVPPGTCQCDQAFQPIPGTGPYRIVRADPTGMYLDRNPYFREWSHAAQPAGNPDHIVWRFWRSAETPANTVADGDADWLYGPIPTNVYRRVSIQSPVLLHSNPEFAVEFLSLNTRRAPRCER